MNTKLSRTIMSATLLVGALALAGCGGGDDTPAEESGMSAEDKRVADAEAAQAAAEAEAEKAKTDLAAKEEAEAEAKAAMEVENARKMAKMLHGVLNTRLADADGLMSVAEPAELDDDDLVETMKLSMMGKTYEDRYKTDAPMLSNTEGNDLIAGSAFSTIGTKEHKANGVDDDGDAVFTTSGSYHGVAGTYTCEPAADSTCTSMVHTNGKLVLDNTVGTWTFKPTDAKARVMDPDIAEYGWWADKDDDGVVTDLAVFYSSKTAADGAVTGLHGFGGKATYKGDAIGKYAIYRGAGAENDSGHFTADAELNATFAGVDASMLSGKIENFKGADGESRDWTVTLNSTPFSATGALTPSDGAKENTTVWTMGDVTGDAGSEWVANMYDPGAGPSAPSTVVGAFEATHGTVGAMIGAFGAEKE